MIAVVCASYKKCMKCIKDYFCRWGCLWFEKAECWILNTFMIALSLKGSPADHEILPNICKSYHLHFLWTNPWRKKSSDQKTSYQIYAPLWGTLWLVLTIMHRHCTRTLEGKFVWALEAISHLGTPLIIHIVPTHPLPTHTHTHVKHSATVIKVVRMRWSGCYKLAC